MRWRGIGLFLIAVMLIGGLFGCGQKDISSSGKTDYVADSNLNPPGQFPVCKKNITIKVAIPSQTIVTDYVNNSYTKKLEEKMNCKLEFEFLPSTNPQQKVELMMAAGGKDLPDVIIGTYLSDYAVTTYGMNGLLLPLNQYYEKSSYYLKEIMEKDPELKDMITMSDGNIYVVPGYPKAMQNEFINKMWMYMPWLEKLGLNVPTTLDEFKTVLRAFKSKDPNGNGIADEIPFIGATNGFEANFKEYILSSFINVSLNTDYLYPENGVVKAAYMDERWKEGLKYLNQLCKEGLLSSTSFTTNSTQVQQVIQNPEAVLVGSFVTSAPTFLNSSDERKEGYKIISPLKGYDNTRNSLYQPTLPGNSFMITKNCQNPEAAFRLGDIMCSLEMTIHSRWGEKGVDWVEPAEGEKSLFDSMGYPPTIKPILEWGSPQNSHWQNQAPCYRDYAVSLGQVISAQNYFEAEIARGMPGYLECKPKESIKKLIYTIDQMDTINEIQSTIKNFLTDNTTRFIVGDLDIDSNWDNYIKKLKEIGVDELISTAQSAYDKVNKQ